MKPRKSHLEKIYTTLLDFFGPQHWWPGNSSFEIIVGAILTQNTNWTNVEKAIANLKKAKSLTPKRLKEIPTKKLAKLIQPSGYYNIKAKRLKSFIAFLYNEYTGSIKKMFKEELHTLREALLEVKGIGPETADSILLYAGLKPIFVVDAYTKRVLNRHKLIPSKADYHEIQQLFLNNLPKEVQLFNEYHALIVRLGKEYCKKTPKCNECPLNN